MPVGFSYGLFTQALTTRIDQDYQKAKTYFNVPNSRAMLSLVLAGYDLDLKKPVLACISNFEALGTLIRTNLETKKPLYQLVGRSPVKYNVGEFTCTVSGFIGQHPRVIAHGNMRALTPAIAYSLQRRMRDVEKRQLGHIAARQILVEVLREATSQIGGDTISKNCLSMMMFRDGSVVEAGTHSKDGTEWIMPRLVSPGFQMELWRVK